MKNPNISIGWDDKLNSWLGWLTHEKELSTTLQQEKNETEFKPGKINISFTKENAIVDDLLQNYKKVEDAEMMWHKWKKVTITLPAVWDFEEYKFSYFISDKPVNREDFESNPELEKKSYSTSGVCELLEAMDKYMSEKLNNDWNMNYENGLKSGCHAWNCLRAIIWSDLWLLFLLWLSDDEKVDWRKGLQYAFGSDYIYSFDDDDLNSKLNGYLFLKLSN